MKGRGCVTLASLFSNLCLHRYSSHCYLILSKAGFRVYWRPLQWSPSLINFLWFLNSLGLGLLLRTYVWVPSNVRVYMKYLFLNSKSDVVFHLHKSINNMFIVHTKCFVLHRTLILQFILFMFLHIVYIYIFPTWRELCCQVRILFRSKDNISNCVNGSSHKIM